MASTTAATTHFISNTVLGATGGAGVDLTVYGDTNGSYMMWDASANTMKFAGVGGIAFGTLSSSSQTGVTLSASNNEVIEVYADDGNATLGNAVYSTIRSRTMLFKDCTGISLFGIRGQIKCADEIDFASGVYAPVGAYFETMDDTDIQSGAKFWGVDSSIESPANGAVTVDSGGILGGLHAELTGGGQFVQSSGGILAGLYIDEQVTTGTWGYGIYMPGNFGTNAVYIRNTQGTTALPTIDSQSTFSATSGYHVGAQFYGTVSGVGTGSVYALRGHAANSATQTDQSAAQYIIGVHGRVINSGTCNDENTILAGVLGQVLNGGTYTEVSMLNSIWADWQNTATVTSGTKNMIYITNNANQVVDNAFYIKAGIGSGTISNLFSLNTLGVNDGMVKYQDVKTTHGGTYRNIRILINDTVYWLIVSDTPT